MPIARQVIVSGATGFIGQHLVPLLVEANYSVVALVRDPSKARRHPWHDKVRIVQCDLQAGPPPLDPAPEAGLIHLAWSGLPNYRVPLHLEMNFPKSREFVETFVERGVRQVLVTGTCLEYGNVEGPVPSGALPAPTVPYAIAKAALHRDLANFQAERPFILQWARLFYTYGQGQNAASVLAQLDAAIDRGDAVFNMSGGEQLRDYLPVEDVARKLFHVFESGAGGAFNVCSGRPISIKQLVEARIRERGASIRPNLGYYPYNDYEPMAFWGVPDTP